MCVRAALELGVLSRLRLRLLNVLAVCAPQSWDINEKLPEEVEGPFHVAVATNVLHTGKNLKSERSPHIGTKQHQMCRRPCHWLLCQQRAVQQC